VVRAGQEFEEEGVTVKIVEVQPYVDAAGKASYMISYELLDGKYTSPVAHFWMSRRQDIRQKITEVVQYYLSVVRPLRAT
jgi:hypothetical protein